MVKIFVRLLECSVITVPTESAARMADFRTDNFNSCFPGETPIYLFIWLVKRFNGESYILTTDENFYLPRLSLYWLTKFFLDCQVRQGCRRKKIAKIEISGKIGNETVGPTTLKCSQFGGYCAWYYIDSYYLIDFIYIHLQRVHFCVSAITTVSIGVVKDTFESKMQIIAACISFFEVIIIHRTLAFTIRWNSEF